MPKPKPEPIDTSRLTAICYARCLPRKFVKKHILNRMSEDGAETMLEYMGGEEQTMSSVEVWSLLRQDDRNVLSRFIKIFGKYKWRWQLVRETDLDTYGIRERTHSNKDK